MFHSFLWYLGVGARMVRKNVSFAFSEGSEFFETDDATEFWGLVVSIGQMLEEIGLYEEFCIADAAVVNNFLFLWFDWN